VLIIQPELFLDGQQSLAIAKPSHDQTSQRAKQLCTTNFAQVIRTTRAAEQAWTSAGKPHESLIDPFRFRKIL